MKVLISGLRGVGKSTLRIALSERFDIPSRSVGDFMEDHCQRRWPEISREEMQQRLGIERQVEILHELTAEVARFEDLILEAQSVISDRFGILIPTQPLLRMMGLNAIILLVAPAQVILDRRLSDPVKRRVQKFLDETTEAVEHQQRLTEVYLASLTVNLNIHCFVIEAMEPRETLETATHALRLTQYVENFRSTINREGA